MISIEEKFLNVLEGKIYAIIGYFYQDSNINLKILAKWITYEKVSTFQYHCERMQISYLFIWKNGMWHSAAWSTGKPSDNDPGDTDNITQRAFELLYST